MFQQYEDRDKGYAVLRNKLIPDAEAYANKLCKASFPGGPQSMREAWTAKWNRTYHGKMDQLWKDGLIG